MNRKNRNLVIVRSVLEQGLSPAQAAAKFGITRQWVHVLLGRYETGGPDALESRSRAPQGAFTGAMVVAAMNELITTHGPPASTLTDNGLVFTTRLARYKGARNGFEKLLQTHRIKQKNGSPGHPQTQGKIERFHQTLKRWLAARPRPATLADLQDLLDTFRTWYNHQRPHRATGRRTPATAYTALPKATPDTTAEPEWRTRTDKVDKHGKITLRYAGRLRHLGIGRAWIGTTVLILIHDDEVTTSDAATGQIIAEHTLDPAKDYQPPRRGAAGGSGSRCCSIHSRTSETANFRCLPNRYARGPFPFVRQS